MLPGLPQMPGNALLFYLTAAHKCRLGQHIQETLARDFGIDIPIQAMPDFPCEIPSIGIGPGVGVVALF